MLRTQKIDKNGIVIIWIEKSELNPTKHAVIMVVAFRISTISV